MRTLAVLATLLLLSACSLPVFFRVPVVQGNVVTAKEVNKLEIGMTKRQVEYVMGTPLIDAGFEKDRWDYVFYYRDPRAHVRQSELNLFFVNDHLSSIEGNEEYVAQAKSRTPEGADDSQFQDTPLPSRGTPLPSRKAPMPSDVTPGPNNEPLP